MHLNVTRELAALRQMSVGELRDRYRAVFGEKNHSRHKGFLIRRILWQLQARELGGLSERARRRAEELADDTQLRLNPPQSFKAETESGPTVTACFHHSHDNRLPPSGTLLTRDYRGRTVTVLVLDKGFEFEGKAYRSLSAAVREATGIRWNGFNFFHLDHKGDGE
jgi:hypothetical protein